MTAITTGADTAASTAPAPKRRRRRKKIDWFPYLLVSPAIILILLITIYPAFEAIRLSFQDVDLLRFDRGEPVGFGNYSKAFGDDVFVSSLWKTLRWVTVVAGIQLLIALPVALFLNMDFKGRGFVRAAVLIPYIVPAAVVAIIWRFMVDANFGVINDLLLKLGLIDQYEAWISQPNPAFAIIATALIWAGFPLMAIILLAAVQAVPTEIYEAGKIDGASAWQQFRHLTLPLLKPTILLLLLLRTIWLSHNIDFIFIMSEGGPGFANYTTAVYAFILTWGRFEIGYPSAIAVVLALILLAASILYVKAISDAREDLR